MEPYKIKGQKKVHLWWSGATTTYVMIKRDGAVLNCYSYNDGLYTDNNGKHGPNSRLYQVCDILVEGGPEGNCSNEAEAVW